MIIQCDQCRTKFRLDDAKVPGKGAKVRCAKCKNIFFVKKEVVSEEPDLDILLSNLGAQTAPSATETAPEGIGAAPEKAEAGGEEQAEATALGALDETPPATEEQHAGRDDFAEDFFSDGEEPASEKKEGQGDDEYRFGEVPAGPGEAPLTTEGAAGEKDGFDFGEFPFEGEEKTADSNAAPAQDNIVESSGELDFGSIDFGPDETKLQPEPETPAAVTASAEPGEFVFEGEEAGPSVAIGGAVAGPLPDLPEKDEFDFGVSDTPSPVEKDLEPAITSEEEVNVKWGSHEPELGKTEEAAPGVTFEPFSEGKATPVITAPAPEPDVAKEPVIPLVATRTEEEEELPPLSITSRKRESSIFPIMVTSVAILVVLAVGGVGLFVFKEGPEALDRLGLSFLAKWIGMQSSDQSNIVVKNPQGAFMVNRAAGEIFVVSGEVVNNYKEARASIQVKATILGPKGEPILQKTAYCGNLVSKDQLTTLPMEKIEESMNSPFGDSLANMGISPGKSIPFVVVFTKVPKNAGEFTVEVVGSSSVN